MHTKYICQHVQPRSLFIRVSHNSSQIRRLSDLVLSQSMDAGHLNKLKPRLPLLFEMHRLCSLARFTYSEFGLTFDSNVTARYAARVAELGRAPTQSRTFKRSLLPPASPSRPQGQYPAVALLCLGRGATFPRVHRPCGATIISNPPLRPAHYPILDPLLLPGGLATSVPAPPHA